MIQLGYIQSLTQLGTARIEQWIRGYTQPQTQKYSDSVFSAFLPFSFVILLLLLLLLLLFILYLLLQLLLVLSIVITNGEMY